MNWYLAKLIFQVSSGEETQTTQFDEQWRLIRADEVAWACEKASVLARLDEKRNDEQGLMKFIGVEDIQQIGEWEDGAQLFSATTIPKDVHAYIEQIKVKSKKAFTLSVNNELTLSRPA